uniref:Uncharacterized protein n=1 Tax=viral metagenome TaxID=1070528 RepID=A0A6M3X6G5_9ZZZZ
MTPNNDSDHDRIVRIDENLKYISSSLNNLLPRLSKLEKDRDYFAGVLAFFSVLIPIIIAIIIFILSKVF